jgi:alkylation response protein AidB-like acyl-CoA dehydrogenase
MDFVLSADQEALRDGIRSLCVGRFGIDRVRGGFDRAVWDELASTGVFSLLADGFGWADAAVTFEELGRALVPGPLVWGLLAHGLVDGIVGGVERPEDGVTVVEHLSALDALVILGPAGVEQLDPGVVRDSAEELEWPLDPLTPGHRVAALPTGDRIADAATAEEWRRAGAVVTAAYAIGIAQACLEDATHYALEREQFNRPIGSFQAVKHMLADMAVRVEVARAAVHSAAVMLDDPEIGDVGRAVAGAKLLAGEAALANAKTSLQVHGGMGFTWEVDVHLYLKRAWLLDTMFGSVDQHADAVAASLS